MLFEKLYKLYCEFKKVKSKIDHKNCETKNKQDKFANHLIRHKYNNYLTYVIREGPFKPIKDKPAFFPGFDLAAHLHKMTLAHFLCNNDKRTCVHAVA